MKSSRSSYWSGEVSDTTQKVLDVIRIPEISFILGMIWGAFSLFLGLLIGEWL